ncbi:Penicillin-binding protein transpeptidase domain-containing protein [Desulfarculales bacterium]
MTAPSFLRKPALWLGAILATVCLLALPETLAPPHAQAAPPAGGLDKPQLKQLLSPRTAQVMDGRPFTMQHPRLGALTVESAIWPYMQEQAEDLLDGLKSARAALTLVDAATGRVLVMAGIRQGRLDPGVALDGAALAASLYKIVTAAAAVEETAVNPMSRVYFTGRPHSAPLQQAKVEKTKKATPATLRESFATSNNPVFAKLGVYHVGGELLLWYGKALGFEHQLPFELPLGISRLGDADDKLAVAGLASGYNRETTISPVHAALLAGVFVNHGRLMEPYVVNRVVNASDEVLYAGRPRSLGRIVSEDTCRSMQKMFEATITEGTAKRAFARLGQDQVLRNITLGGKTGTMGSPDHTELYEWFAGYGRDERTGRTLAVSAVVVHNHTRYANAKQLARQLLRQAFSIPTTHVGSQPRGDQPRM